MKLIRMAGLSIILLMVLAFAESPQAIGQRNVDEVDFTLLDVSWGQKDLPIEPQPGDKAVPLIVAVIPSAAFESSIRITAVSGQIRYDWTYSDEPVYITSRDGSASEKDYVEGTYGLGERIEFHYTVNLDKQMPLGTYLADLTIEFKLAERYTGDGSPYRVTVPLEILGRADIKYRLEPLVLAPGAINTVNLVVENNGSAQAYSLETDFNADKTEIVQGDTPWITDSLPSKSSIRLPFTLYVHPDLENRIGKAIVSTEYRSEYGNNLAVEKQVSFTVESMKNLFSQNSSAKLKAGQENEGSITLTYKGQTTLERVDVALTATAPSAITGESQWTFYHVQPGDTIPLTLRMFTDITVRAATVTMIIEYPDSMGTLITEILEQSFPVEAPSEGATTLHYESFIVKAGGTTDIKLYLRNNRTAAISNVDVESQISQPFAFAGSSIWSFSKIDQGKEVELVLAIDAPTSALGATGSLSIIVKYTDQWGYSSSDIHRIGFTASESLQQGSITLEVSPLELTSGANSTLSITLNNEQNFVLQDVQVAAKTDGTLRIIGSSLWSFPIIKQAEVVSFSLKVFAPEGVTGVLTLQFDIMYSDAWGELQTENRGIGLVVGGASTSPILATAVGGEVVAGTRSNYTLLISNTADHMIEGVELEIEPPGVLTIIATEGRWPLGRLLPGEAREVIVPVFAFDKSVGSKGTLSLSLSYSDRGVLRSERKSLDFTIVGLMDLRITDIVFTPHPLEAGSKFSVSATLFNTGNVDAKAVTVSYTVSHPFLREAAATEALIGDVSSGSQVPFSLTGRISADIEPGTYPLELKVSFKDDRGIWRSLNAIEEAEIIPPGSVQEEEPAQELFSIPSILIGLVVGIAVTGIALKIKRR